MFRIRSLSIATWMVLCSCTEQKPPQDNTQDSPTLTDTALNNEPNDSAETDSNPNEDNVEDTGAHTSEPSNEQHQDLDALNQHFSNHFQTWLANSYYNDSDLTRLDLQGGSFGGFIDETYPLDHEPVLFIHGNSDRSIGGVLGGWTTQRNHFLEMGFNNAELYATTYGPADSLYAINYRHDAQTLKHIRDFIEAVLAYTGATKIDIVTHSLGVTLTRKAILGGSFTDANQTTIQLGDPLTDRVDTFIGIAGANQGLASCIGSVAPTCSGIDGLYPGTLLAFEVTGQSQILQSINNQTAYEAEHRYSIWSQADEVLGFGCIVWGVNTARIPSQTNEKLYISKSHLDLKEDTAEIVYAMTQEHRIP